MNKLRLCEKEFLDSLAIDKACLNLINYDKVHTLDIWAQSEECFSCSSWKYLSMKPGHNATLEVNSTYPTNFYIHLPQKVTNLCSFRFHFIQQGIYSLQFNSSSVSPIVTEHKGNNEYIAILAAFLFFIILYFFWVGTKWLKKKMEEETCYQGQNENGLSTNLLNEERLAIENEAETRPIEVGRAAVTITTTTGTRLHSIDTFRGMTIAIMIFVNYGGGKYYFFRHSSWNGLTVGDLVFPWFLWIMGFSLTFSMKSQLRRMTPYFIITLKIIKRSLSLFLLGLICNSLLSNYLPELRISGVLQRFAFCYLINAVLELRMKPQEPTEYFMGWWLRDLIWGWVQWLITILLVVLHTVIILALPVPGCPTGYLGPGGVHAEGKYPNCTGGASAYVDQIVLGVNHLHRRPTCQVIYDSTIPFDPEGILGILTSCLTVQLGVAAGRTFLYFPSHYQKLKRWIIWGIVLGIGGGILCSWRKEDGLVPVNKNLWSISYVFVTTSFAFFLLSALYFWIDAKKRWNGSIFRIAGMNSIMLYLGHEVTKNLLPWSWRPVPSRHADHLVMSLWGTSLWLIIAYVCHKKKLYLSL